MHQSADISHQFLDVCRPAGNPAIEHAHASQTLAGGMHQSAAISQQFLDILADLPWSRTSADAAREAEAAGAAAAAAPAGSPQGGSAQEPDAGAAGSSGASARQRRAAAKARKDSPQVPVGAKGTVSKGAQHAGDQGEFGLTPIDIDRCPCSCRSGLTLSFCRF